MGHTVEEYAALLRSLLPPGAAFSREPGTDLEQLLLGCAAEFARVEARADVLALEMNPSTSVELLSDWERALGLPDKCSGELETTIQGRRNAVLAKLTSTGGQSAAYFIAVAAALGYPVTITEFRPFEVGRSVVGEALTNGPWVFTWRVNAPFVSIVDFRTGLSAVGEALRTWGNDTLECKLNQLKPAHTVLQFSYAAG